MTTHGAACRKPEDHLAAADRAFANGDDDTGSILVYLSVECALKRLAEASGLRVETREEFRDFADWLDRQYGGDGWHARKLRLATVFRDNAVHHFAPPGDVALSWPSVREFAQTLIGYQPKNLVDG
jgi:hypothetical protein